MDLMSIHWLVDQVIQSQKSTTKLCHVRRINIATGYNIDILKPINFFALQYVPSYGQSNSDRLNLQLMEHDCLPCIRDIL